jgi:hypothetical protein
VISISHKGDRETARLLGRRIHMEFVILQRRVAERAVEQLRDAVKAGDYFAYAGPTMPGDQRQSHGQLQRTLWASRARRMGDEVHAEAGWGERYGPVMEFGPRAKRRWLIRAKFAKRLRFVGLGDSGKPEIKRPKQVMHYWDRRQLRPHWEPEIKRHWPGIQRQFDSSLPEIKRRFGLG